MSKYAHLEIDLENKDSTHTRVVNLIGEGKTVLEVGCSSGFMSKVLKEEFNCKVYGLEIDAEDGEEAKKYCENVLVADIETEDLAKHYKEGFFDVVVFADVLEHLNDPEAVLKKILPYVKGFIVISIPNISHASIVYELLQGEFGYTPLGLLDETHKKFFTKKSFQKLLEKVGYDIFSTESVDIEPEVTEKGTQTKNFPQEIVDYINEQPESKSYQYVFKAFVANPDIRILKNEVEKLKNEIQVLNTELKSENEQNEQNEQILTMELENKKEEFVRTTQWYKNKLKEALQVNYDLSFKIKELEKLNERYSKYSADFLPKILAYPIKSIFILYKYGVRNIFKHFFGAKSTKQSQSV